MFGLVFLLLVLGVCGWALWARVWPMLRVRQSLGLVLLYSLWVGSFWGVTALRIYFPPGTVLSAVALAMLLAGLWLLYPLLQGVAAQIFSLHAAGRAPTWRAAFLGARKRYPQLLTAFSALIILYGLVVFLVYAAWGDGWLGFFRDREAEMAGSKIDIVWEAVFASFLLSAFVDMVPPVVFPLGVFVGLFNPSSEYLFAMVMASLVAAAIVFIPMLWLIFWLPALTLSGENLASSLARLWRVPLVTIVHKELAVVASCFILWALLVIVSVLLIGSARVPFPLPDLIVKLGRWPVPLYLVGSMPLMLGAFPGIISTAFQQARVHLYREVFIG